MPVASVLLNFGFKNMTLYKTDTQPLLSICIPTFNREAMVVSLVQSILKINTEIDLIVFIDGSTDGTYESLLKIDDSRLRIRRSDNCGRAVALFSAVSMAVGLYTMIFDDDDWIDTDGLSQIISDCNKYLPEGVIGYIYHLKDESGVQVGSCFPVPKSNLIALRADHNVMGDKKEVILTRHIKDVVDRPSCRRVPTSLYWSKLAMIGDVICRNIIVGNKNYMHGGMTSKILSLKKSNMVPLIELNRLKIYAFFKGRYKSKLYLLRSVFGYLYYCFYLGLNRCVKIFHNKR